MIKTALFFIHFCLFIFVCKAQSFRNYSNEFLNIGVDARSLGMGKAVTANTSDLTAGYWNPAGLTGVKDYQGLLMHASYFAGIASFNYGGFAMPANKNSAVSLSVIRFGVDDILNTTELIDSKGNINYNRISLFSAVDYAFNLGYAGRLTKNISIGGNAKVIRRIIGDFASSWGVGFDIGLQTSYNNWQFGVMLRDITNTFNVWAINKSEFRKIKNAIEGKNQELPEDTEISKPKMQIGTAKKYSLSNSFGLLAEIDLNMRFSQTNDLISSNIVSISPAVGVELDFEDLAFLRIGVGNFQKVKKFNNEQFITMQPNFGIGFRYKGIQIDYALTNIGSASNVSYSNIFSVKFDYHLFKL